MSTPTTCENYGAKLKELLECLVEKQGVAVAEYVSGKIQEVVDVHGVDITELTNKINIINQELDQDDVALQGILDAIAALQTATANNQVSITAANTAITNAISNFNSQIAAERAHVDAEIARLEALMPTAYDDTELRTLITNNMNAITGERDARVAEIARLEGIITTNTADIATAKTDIAANTAAIAQNATGLAALTSTVATLRAELEAQITAVSNCLNNVISALDTLSCDALADGFKAGLAMGGTQPAGL